MSIEVHKAPIALDQSKDDLQFTLDESGVITSSTSKKPASTFNKSKELSYDNAVTMASKYSDGYDSYDDDFEDDSPVRNPGSRVTRHRQSSIVSQHHSDYSYSPSPPTTRRNRNASSRRNSLVSYRSAYGPSRAINKPKKAKKSLSASTRPPKTDDNSTMVKKILSANRNKITKLYNVVEELQQEVDTLRQENRTLKRISVKQERELKRVDREEGSLPQLLQRHSAELRTYRQRLKKNKQEIIQKEKESHSHDVELTKLRDKLQHFKQLDNNKKLEERATLAKKLEKVEKALSERDTKILELQKTIKLSEKARQREIKEHQDRYKKAKDELVQVQENVLSLREKLKEKEKQLDMTNIYHQNIQRKLKKVNPLALPPAYEDVNTKTDILLTDQKKRTNVFLTNGVSDTGSNISAEPLKSEEKSVFEVSSEKGKKESLSIVDKNLEYEKQQAEQLKEKLEREDRRRKQEEEKRKEEEARKHEEEQKRIREEEALKDKIRQLEEEKRKKEQQELIEIERKKREEEERLRKAKEEEAHLKFKEDEEIRKKKDLLLARMKAIDAGQEKPNGIISMDINPKAQDNKPKKLPIFLQSSEKHTTTKEPSNEPTIFTEKEKQKFGSSTSIHSKHSKDSSYDVKESFQNLHHGLPAHPSDQHFRGRRNSQDDDVAFGSYKPSVGQRKEANSKTETFGSYNPSFGEPSNRKSSGLHFGKRQENKQDKSDDVVFGSYQPTFSGNSKSSTVPSKDNDSAGALDFSSRRSDGRRKKPSQPNSIFGEDLFDNNKPKQTSIFDDDSFNRSSNKPKDKNYPWETKVSASNDIDDESLLPRRPKLNQGFNHGPKQQIPAVGNILNGTLEDDIEEVKL